MSVIAMDSLIFSSMAAWPVSGRARPIGAGAGWSAICGPIGTINIASSSTLGDSSILGGLVMWACFVRRVCRYIHLLLVAQYEGLREHHPDGVEAYQ